MKRSAFGFKRWLPVLTSAFILSAASCGQSSNSCSSGYNYSATYGCLAQANCPSGTGLYNNQCVSLNTSNLSGNCQAGFVYTAQYGCQPQGGCQPGFAFYNNTCVPGSTYGSPGNCQAGYAYYNNQCVYAGGTPNPYSNPYSNTNCQPGYLYTQYGCQPQGNCGSGFATYQGGCVPAVNPYYGSGNGYGYGYGYVGGYFGAGTCPQGFVYNPMYGCAIY